tara:strand:+ start:109 stop:339 length:231 start_codon:yes stop_codon:yes gene_type:complete
MKYKNKTNNGIYVSIPGGHVYVPAGKSLESPIHFSTPGLSVEFEERPKKPVEKKEKLVEKKEKPVMEKENDVRTTN